MLRLGLDPGQMSAIFWGAWGGTQSVRRETNPRNVAIVHRDGQLSATQRVDSCCKSHAAAVLQTLASGEPSPVRCIPA